VVRQFRKFEFKVTKIYVVFVWLFLLSTYLPTYILSWQTKQIWRNDFMQKIAFIHNVRDSLIFRTRKIKWSQSSHGLNM
jgi:hypothetical protein